MNYIGSKHSLITFLKENIREVLRMEHEVRRPNEMVLADLFAGTGIVGGSFKADGYSIIANDIQYYSYVITKHMIENNGNLNQDRCNKLISELNALEGIEGFIYSNYSYEGTEGQEYRRQYFTEYNAKKCDAIRETLDRWLNSGYITEQEFYFLLGSLLNSVDNCANTALVYGAYLKKLKEKAKTNMVLKPLPIMHGQVECKVYNRDASELIRDIRGDILYLDPPYNSRQYCSNYHILETIARNDHPALHGKTGLRDCTGQKSIFCRKATVHNAFVDLIEQANFHYIFLSYNNEGIMTNDEIRGIMQQYGRYYVYERGYQRFKSDSDQNRNHRADRTTEYLHCLIKN